MHPPPSVQASAHGSLIRISFIISCVSRFFRKFQYPSLPLPLFLVCLSTSDVAHPRSQVYIAPYPLSRFELLLSCPDSVPVPSVERHSTSLPFTWRFLITSAILSAPTDRAGASGVREEFLSIVVVGAKTENKATLTSQLDSAAIPRSHVRRIQIRSVGVVTRSPKIDSFVWRLWMQGLLQLMNCYQN